jgi:hypothetical protein
MVEAEEVDPLATLDQLHQPCLGRLRFQPEVGQQRGEPCEGTLGLAAGPAHHHEIIGVPDQHSVLARSPCPV